MNKYSKISRTAQKHTLAAEVQKGLEADAAGDFHPSLDQTSEIRCNVVQQASNFINCKLNDNLASKSVQYIFNIHTRIYKYMCTYKLLCKGALC